MVVYFSVLCLFSFVLFKFLNNIFFGEYINFWFVNFLLRRIYLIVVIEIWYSVLISSEKEVVGVVCNSGNIIVRIIVTSKNSGWIVGLIRIVCVKIEWVNILVDIFLFELFLKIRTFGLIMVENFRNWDWFRKFRI